ncbi:hypothetical protein L210DRAFT_3647750 [Boletus edulis BED1]|uniref:Uncharacterized protein n=1 Tax=Boletus edulis BED1 TaxID=1328754 RepID=A0AAD4BQ06_BOLED|nr:hypothetical protein L210DRAFT_3647750 [Boletus edulis BED1]
MDIDIDDAEADESSEGEDGEEDSEEVKALKARRRYLRSLLASAQRLPPSSLIHRSKRHPRRSTTPTLNVVPGYSIIIISRGLDRRIAAMDRHHSCACHYGTRRTLLQHVPAWRGRAGGDRVHYVSRMSLKVQMSKSNYLTTLSV